MTQFSRIEMAFEILKAMVAAAPYFSGGNDPDKYRARRAFEQTDAFLEEAKRRGEIS